MENVISFNGLNATEANKALAWSSGLVAAGHAADVATGATDDGAAWVAALGDDGYVYRSVIKEAGRYMITRGTGTVVRSGRNLDALLSTA